MKPRLYLYAFAGALLAVGLFLGWSALATPFGFPLDDAWIHQVFARNLAQRGEFSYNPGQLVAGSTSPLWTFLLVPGYVVEGGYMWWAYALGVIFLALTALEVYRLYLALFGEKQEQAALIALLFTVFEWRLIWAGASGMETLLFTFGTLLLLRLGLASDTQLRKYLLIGLIGGLLTLTRPEGMALLGLVALEIGRRTWGQEGEWLKLIGLRWGAIALTWLLLLVPYSLFNYVASGSLLPNTFSAKAAAYTADNSPLKMLEYLATALVTLLLSGSVIALLPGFIVCLFTPRLKNFNWLPLVWAVTLLLLYAWRLPVTYQHGRYLMPLIPIVILYGVRGSVSLMEMLRKARLPVVARSLPLLAVLTLLITLGIGAIAYRFDVKFINDEQVTVGKWLRDNTPPNVTVASHDIGAIGYFSQRKLVDSAGLVSPSYIPIVRDQPAILRQLQADGVSYLALLPSWYDTLNDTLEKENRKVFAPQETYLEQYGEKNMVIFKIKG